MVILLFFGFFVIIGVFILLIIICIACCAGRPAQDADTQMPGQEYGGGQIDAIKSKVYNPAQYDK